MACIASMAIPAKPTPMTITQPDGSTVTVTLRGDERSHWYQSEDGYVLLRNTNDALVYATVDAAGQLQPSGILAQEVAHRSPEAKTFLSTLNKATVGQALDRRMAQSPRTKAEHQSMSRAPQQAPQDSYGVGLFPGTHFPPIGSPKAVVILVQYSDVKFTISDPYDYFNSMINEPGFSRYSGTGSVMDFFVQNSNNLFTPQFDVFGPVTLPNARNYYGGNDWYGNDQNPEKMAIHACNILDDTVDFSQYDNDGDGKIDNVFIFYAGTGEASGGPSSSVWPHSWDVSAATSTVYRYDGVRLDRYACSNEWTGSRPDGIGTFVHEFSHVMGLPDLYSTNYTSAFTPGGYSALDYGPYNNDGCTPPNYGAFERNALGWMQPEIITATTGACTLPKIADNKAYLIPTSKSSEFFLLENRQKEGWDKYIPGHGMLIWHVDYNKTKWESNVVNDTPSHQYVDIEEADGTQSENTRAGDTWPGTSGKTEFTKDTRPALRTWGNVGIDLDIKNITESRGEISFTVGDVVAPEPDPVTALEVDSAEITPTTFVARWTPSELATSYRIEVKDSEGGYPGKWKLCDVGSNNFVTVTDLQPSSDYFFKVWAVNKGTVSEESNSVDVTTAKATVDFYTTVALESPEQTDTSFVASWEPIEVAEDYLLTVKKEVTFPSYTDTVDFANDLVLPAGWTTDAMFVYKATHYGQAPSSLRFTNSGYVQSPTYPDVVSAYSFWSKGINCSAGNTIVVKGYSAAAKAWVTLNTYPVSFDEEGVTIACDSLPEEVVRIRLEYVESEHKGYLALDDITVTYGGTLKELADLQEYTELATGNTTTFDVTGLEPSTTYVYTVQAINGRLKAVASKQVRVTTKDREVDSLAGIAADNVALIGRELTSAEPVQVYTVDGRLVATGTRITLTPGVYIVRASTPKKIIVK